eukprot:scaffold23390_cov137-Cylindrotheca_fusiformis.AAC.2
MVLGDSLKGDLSTRCLRSFKCTNSVNDSKKGGYGGGASEKGILVGEASLNSGSSLQKIQLARN